MDLGFEKNVAVITGASSGIGYAIASSLVKEGCEVVLVSRGGQKLDEAKLRLQNEFPKSKIHTEAVDLTLREDCQKKSHEIAKKYSPTILVYNTGGPAPGKIRDLSEAQWDTGYQSLFKSLQFFFSAMLFEMEKANFGRVLVVTSTSAKEWMPGLPVSGFFRSGVESWVKTVSKEFGTKGILINSLLPGPTNTDRMQELKVKNAEFYKQFMDQMAIGQLIDPKDIGSVAAFLVSKLNQAITGTSIIADGGYTRAL